jgi:quaternary ammonium compound-resistance protein SugE
MMRYFSTNRANTTVRIPKRGREKMGWSYLLVAIALEIAWASTLKWTEGYTRPGPSLVNLVLCLANVFFLSQAIKILPTALAYSIWTGLGAVGVAIVAYWLQGEAFGLAKIGCMALILLGATGLKAFSPG